MLGIEIYYSHKSLGSMSGSWNKKGDSLSICIHQIIRVFARFESSGTRWRQPVCLHRNSESVCAIHTVSSGGGLCASTTASMVSTWLCSV